MLKVGDRIPEFTAQTADGKTIRSAELRGKHVVLYFFPKAFTTGCSIETKQFRDAYPDLQKAGAEVLGVSVDDGKTQNDFACSLGVSFPMIGDHGKQLSKQFGVLWPLLGVPRRVTFLIDKEGVIRGVFNHELQIGRHLDDALALLKTLPA